MLEYGLKNDYFALKSLFAIYFQEIDSTRKWG